MRKGLVALAAVMLSLSMVMSASKPAEARHGRWAGAVAAGLIGGVVLHHALRRDRYRYRTRYYYGGDYYYGGYPYYSYGYSYPRTYYRPYRRGVHYRGHHHYRGHRLYR